VIRFALSHTHLVVVSALVVVILGVTSTTQMEVDVFPDLHQPAVMVAVNYAGMPAEDMEASITRRLERMFIQAGGIDHMESRSITGMGLITIYFNPTVDVNAAISQVISLAIADLSRLPPGTLPPLVINYDVSGQPVCEVTLSSDRLSQTELYDIANYTIREQLGNVPGVSAPPVYGGLVRQVMVYVDPEKLLPLGLSPMDVVRAVGESNVIVPTGVAKIGGISYDVMSNAEFPTPKMFNDVPVATRNGRTIFVRDIGRAEDANQIVTNIVRVDGRRSVYIPIAKQAGANTIRVVDAVKKAAKHFKNIPEDLKVDVVFDQSVYVREAVKQLEREGVLGAVLAGLCVLFFLASVRSTAAIVLAIPLCTLAALVGLLLFGQTINLMTLGGLALTVGRLIDDAVVVIENTIRHLSMKGAEPRKAAAEAADEVAVPVLASTLTTMIVLLPIAFLSGLAKYLFTPLALAVVLAMAASYVFAMMFVPVFCQHVLEPAPADGKKNALLRGFERFQSGYGRRLETTLAHRSILYAVVAALLASSTALILVTGYEFYPDVDAGTFTLHIRAPSGMRVEDLETNVCEKAENIIRRLAGKDLQRIVSNLGIAMDPFAAMGSKNSAEHEGFIQVKLVPDHDIPTKELVRKLREQLPTAIPGTEFLFQVGGITTAAINYGRIAPIDVQVLNEDYQKAHDLAVEIRSKVETVRGVVDPLVNVRLDYPTLHLDVDRWKAAVLGLTENDVVRNVVTSLSSSVFVHPIIWIDPKTGNDYFAAVQYREKTIDSLETLRNVPLAGKGEHAFKSTLIRNVAPLTRIETMTQATHYNILRSEDLYLGVEGRDLGSVASDVEKVVKSVELPKGTDVRVRGALKTLRESFRSFGFALMLSVVLIYLLHVAQFRSTITPFIIMAVIPLAGIGVFVILPATRTTYNIQTLLGILMLIGIVHSNSLLMVEFAERTHEQGKSPLESAIAAGVTRLRPVIMTALATVFALFPMALGIERGSEANVPLARAVIGGLMAATFLTLFVVPALYVTVTERLDRRRHAAKQDRS
jgi:multidrug efflux pump subunit AcrB